MSEDGSNPSERPRIQITEELAEFIHKQALVAATWRFPEHVDPHDVAQEVAFTLIRRPPRFDPEGKAKLETFLKSCIRNRVQSALRKVGRFSLRHAQVVEDEQRDEEDVKKHVRSPSLHNGERPFQQDIKEFTAEDVFRHIDCDSSRALCVLYLECKANMSEVARHMGVSEGTIRYRLKKLAPKLLKAGLKPFLNPREVFFVANRRHRGRR